MKKTEIIGNKFNAWVARLSESAKKFGGRVHVIPLIRVDYRKKLFGIKDAKSIKATSNIYDIASEYADTKHMGVRQETIVLFNPGKRSGERDHVNYLDVIIWGLENGLRKTTPHTVVEIVENASGHIKKTGKSGFKTVLETTGCFWHLRYLCGTCDFPDFNFEGHVVDVKDEGGWYSHVWFAFSVDPSQFNLTAETENDQLKKSGKPRITYLTKEDVDPNDFVNINHSYFLVRVTERLRKDRHFCSTHKLQLVEHDGYLVRWKKPISQGGPNSRNSPGPLKKHGHH